MSARWKRAGDFIAADGSTRAVSLVRLGLPLLVWTDWGGDLLPFRDLRPVVALIGLSTLTSTAVLFFGYRSRIAAFWTALSIAAVLAYRGHVLGSTGFIHHHTHLLLLTALLLAFTPCGGSYSADRWLLVRRTGRTGSPVPDERGPLWGQRLLCVLVSSVYLWSAWDKSSPAFVSGARLQHIYLELYGGSVLPPWPLASLFAAAASGTIALEVFLGIGLWVPRTRTAAIFAGILFHLTLYYTLPVATFSLQMLLLYVLFLDPNALHAFLDSLSKPLTNTKGPPFEDPSGRRGEI